MPMISEMVLVRMDDAALHGDLVVQASARAVVL
ncbi:hydrolase, partial [Streptomyces sp. SID6139]|nr:hydrolase [Streptomyces sp. SID6139]